MRHELAPRSFDHAAEGVETFVASATNLSMLHDATVDVIFASNLVEHLTHDQIDDLLREADRVLVDGGRVILIQPNFRLRPRQYFDDYTHVSIWSHVGLTGFLRARRWEIERVDPRFLPLTVKSRLPVRAALTRAYLKSPIKPLTGQMLVVARKPHQHHGRPRTEPS